MAAYEKPEGTVALSKYDLDPVVSSSLINFPRFQTKPLHGDQFTEVMPMWKLRTWDMWSKYAQAHFSKHQSIVRYVIYIHSLRQVTMAMKVTHLPMKNPTLSLKRLPALSLIPLLVGLCFQRWAIRLPKNAKIPCVHSWQKHIVSLSLAWHQFTFIKHFIGNFTRDSQAKVPWKDLSLDEQHELISKDSFPEDMRLLDPSKLQRCDVEALWQHWTRRQKANARPLIFYASAAVNIRRAKARPSRPKKARRPSPQHVSEEEDNGDNEDDDEDDDEDEADNKKSETPHPHSPAANAASPSSKIDFLRNLSSDLVYTEFMDRLSSRKEVSVLLYDILIQSDIHCI